MTASDPPPRSASIAELGERRAELGLGCAEHHIDRHRGAVGHRGGGGERGSAANARSAPHATAVSPRRNQHRLMAGFIANVVASAVASAVSWSASLLASKPAPQKRPGATWV